VLGPSPELLEVLVDVGTGIREQFLCGPASALAPESVLVDEVMDQGVTQQHQLFEVDLGSSVSSANRFNCMRVRKQITSAGGGASGSSEALPLTMTYDPNNCPTNVPSVLVASSSMRAERMASSECAGPEVS
jgi:hypothetical protein